jgi:hypothetical protein
MIKINKCHNSENMNCYGLDISIQGMIIRILSGEVNFGNNKLIIEDHEITLEVIDQDRMLYIRLFNDSIDPLVCFEEIGKGNGETLPNFIDTILRANIPANCMDLSDADIEVWRYEDIPDRIEKLPEGM